MPTESVEYQRLKRKEIYIQTTEGKEDQGRGLGKPAELVAPNLPTDSGEEP
jgi:hypothetical protein